MQLQPLQRIWTTQLSEHTGQRVKLSGWLHRLRPLSQVTFLVLRDAQGLAQVVIEEPTLAARLAKLPHESVLSVEGTVVAEPQAPRGVEIHQPEIEGGPFDCLLTRFANSEDIVEPR